MKLHLLGLPHTITNLEFSHCAFTGKILRFPSMMKGLGYEIIHYGVEGAETEANEQVQVMTKVEQAFYLGHAGDDKTKFYADDANTEKPIFLEFNKRLRELLANRVTQADLVLLPFGHGHHGAVGDMPYKLVESGIGYPTLYNQAPLKIFESNAWMHFHQGRENRWGKNYEWVIPNYFNPGDWKLQLKPDQKLVVFLGRICKEKGLATIVEVAKARPDLKFVICGQGDPEPYLTQDNILYLAPMTGKIRSMLLGTASAVLMPTEFTEPFGGVSVEAQLCGTPVLSTTYGGFTETIEDEVTGFRCHTLGDYLAALNRVQHLDRQYICDRARRLWGYDRVSKMYDRAFQMIDDLRGEGWYSRRSVFSCTEYSGPKLLKGATA